MYGFFINFDLLYLLLCAEFILIVSDFLFIFTNYDYITKPTITHGTIIENNCGIIDWTVLRNNIKFTYTHYLAINHIAMIETNISLCPKEHASIK